MLFSALTVTVQAHALTTVVSAQDLDEIKPLRSPARPGEGLPCLTPRYVSISR